MTTSSSAREPADHQVFDLTRDPGGDYILEMQLRRLTRFSRIELEKAAASELRREAIAGAGRRSWPTTPCCAQVVSAELADVATTYGTPRRTVLLASAGLDREHRPPSPLEVADDPCRVYLSSSGLLARTVDLTAPGSGGGRAKHDVVLATVLATARGQVGALTTRGRILKLDVLDLPTLPGTANHPHLQGGAPVSEFLPLDPGEGVLTLTSLDADGPGLALGTRRGVVKRVLPEPLASKDAWEVVRLDDADSVVGAVELRSGTEELCFVTSDAQLLHFPADSVRVQGRAGGGVAGVRLARDAHVVFFGAVEPADDAEVVTVSGSGAALPGTEPGSVKVTPFAGYPAKGRGTGGVRCHRFLKGEDTLVFAWAGRGPARAAAASGSPVELPPPTGRRDGSGEPGTQPVLAVAGPITGPITGSISGTGVPG